MKTLHLPIIAIAILVIGTSFFINEKASACNYCTMIPSPPQSAHPPITISTNLQNYTVADTIIVSGHLSNPNGKLPLVIKVYDPFHQERAYKLFPVWTNEIYTWMIPPASFYSSGNYTVLSQYGRDSATSHFFLSYDIDQYLKTLSPLQQHKMFPGTLPQDFHCRTGFQLILKAEDLSPACVRPLTASNLITWGWALGTTQPPPLLKNMSIDGLRQNYFVDQPINASVVYSGYYWYTEPEVKILDANGVQVWFNCPFCYTRTEPVPVISSGVFTYQVREYSTNALPVINKTGTYMMVATLDNKMAEANFTVISNQTLSNRNSDQQTGHPEEFDGAIVDQSLDATHQYSLYTNDTSVKFNIGSNGIWLEGLNNIDGLDGKHSKIFGTLMQVSHGEDKINVDKFQIIGSYIPQANSTRNMTQQITLEELYSDPGKYYNQAVTIMGQLREYDNPIAYAGVGCSSAQFTTNESFVPDFVSRHQLYNGQNYIGVRIGGAGDVGYSPTEKLPADLKNKSVFVTGIFVPEIHDMGMCMHVLHKSGYLLTDFSKIQPTGG